MSLNVEIEMRQTLVAASGIFLQRAHNGRSSETRKRERQGFCLVDKRGN